MITVFRYENERGQGPYSEALSEYVVPTAFNWRRPPARRHVWLEHDVRFAFRTYDQVRRWFTPRERQALRQAGFRLKRFQANGRAVVYRDHAQVAVKADALQEVA